MTKRADILERNEQICAMRKRGARVKEIASAFGVRDHVVTKALRMAGLSNPHQAQLGPKPSHAENIIQRPSCLSCREPFLGHRWQFRCDECLRAAAKICVL